MRSEPFIVYEDNIIFKTTYVYINDDTESTVIIDIKYFITPYGFYVPTDIISFKLLKYLKNPTQKNKEKLKGFTHNGFIINTDGELLSISTSYKTNWKLFITDVPFGKGIKAIHNTRGDETENVGSLLFMARSYEEFLKHYLNTIDPNNTTAILTFSDITKLLFAAGVNKSIETSDLAMDTIVDFVED